MEYFIKPTVINDNKPKILQKIKTFDVKWLKHELDRSQKGRTNKYNWKINHRSILTLK